MTSITALRPLIGIPSSDVRRADPPTPNWVFNLSLRSTYADAVWKAGGLPVALPPLEELASVCEYVQKCDGFIFPGGPDIDPQLFGQELHPKSNLVEKRRENFDLALIQAVLEADRPWLAICMGCQAVNIVCGGTLFQDIEDLVDGAENHTSKRDGGADRPPRHQVTIVPGSRLHGLAGSSTLLVNTSHHQAVDRPGEGLVVTAKSPDGIIEALEHPASRFGMALQWHPEWLTDEPAHLAVFESLVQASRGA